jgi:hypothetical protein
VAAIDVGMRDAGEDGEVVAMSLEILEAGREGVIAAFGLGEEVIGEEAEVVADGDHAAGFGSGGFGGSLGAHGVEPRESKGDAGAAEKGAA